METMHHHKYQELKAGTPRGHLIPQSFLQKQLHTAIEDKSRHLPGGGTIDTFLNFDGGCCWSYR
jgi:hypothetical protein